MLKLSVKLLQLLIMEMRTLACGFVMAGDQRICFCIWKKQVFSRCGSMFRLHNGSLILPMHLHRNIYLNKYCKPILFII